MAKHRSMRGVSIDLSSIMAGQEKNITVGNTKSNARGDQLGRGGRVVKSAAEIARDHYNQNPPQAVTKTSIKTDDKVSTKTPTPVIEDDWVEPMQDAAPTEASTEAKVEWVEDENGDFVKAEDNQKSTKKSTKK